MMELVQGALADPEMSKVDRIAGQRELAKALFVVGSIVAVCKPLRP